MIELTKLQASYKQVVSQKLKTADGPGMALAKRIEQLFKDRCAQFKKETHLNFGVYFTPQNHQWAA